VRVVQGAKKIQNFLAKILLKNFGPGINGPALGPAASG
jgi:hypothetical protein